MKIGLFRFIPLLFFSNCLGYDFLLEFELVYKINKKDIFEKNNYIEISKIGQNPNIIKKIIINENGKIMIDEDLNFYYQNKKFENKKEDIEIELQKIDGKYIGSIYKEAKSKFLDLKNCSLIVRAIDARRILTKNKSILINLNELKTLNNARFYLNCTN